MKPENIVRRGGRIGGEGKRTKVENELDDLHYGDVLLPPDLDAPRALEIVPVHDNMHHQIECDHRPGNGGMTNKLGVAEESGRAMVVGVEEG